MGLDIYGSTFGTSPLVFGAFPSLHSGCATIEMLFFSYLFPKVKPIAIFYVMWMWFSTMYLTHHYMIDLVGGSIYAILAFVVAQKFLPNINSEHCTRLEYLGITKLSIRSFIYSIEHDPRNCYSHLPVVGVIGDEESAAVMKEINSTSVAITPIIHQGSNNHSYRHHHINNRPEPLRLQEMNEKRDTDSPYSSPASLAPSTDELLWSPNSSEPSSPITPHSIIHSTNQQFGFKKP